MREGQLLLLLRQQERQEAGSQHGRTLVLQPLACFRLASNRARLHLLHRLTSSAGLRNQLSLTLAYKGEGRGRPARLALCQAAVPVAALE